VFICLLVLALRAELVLPNHVKAVFEVNNMTGLCETVAA